MFVLEVPDQLFIGDWLLAEADFPPFLGKVP